MVLGSTLVTVLAVPPEMRGQFFWLVRGWPALLAVAFGAVGAAVLSNAMFKSSSDENRQRLRWIHWGLTAAILAFLTFVALLGLGIILGFDSTVLTTALTFTLLIPPLCFLVGLIVAVFYEGAVDPALAIRRTGVYGALGVLFMFAFAGLGNVASDLVEARLGLPGALGTGLYGGSIAVILIPVKRRMDLFMDRMLPVTALAGAPTRLSTILFSDIVGYTRLTGEDQSTALTIMSVFHKAAGRVAREHRARMVKTIADEVMLEFKEVRHAVDSARSLREEFHEATRKLDLPSPELSTGLHYGVVVHSREGDLFGDAVNIASRVQGVAEPGQIVLSQAVAAQLEGVELEDLGEQSLKNVPEPVRCWAVST